MNANAPSCKRWTDEGQKDKIMRKEIRELLAMFKAGFASLDYTTDQILSLLDENTEGVSTTSCTESGRLHDVS